MREPKEEKKSFYMKLLKGTIISKYASLHNFCIQNDLNYNKVYKQFQRNSMPVVDVILYTNLCGYELVLMDQGTLEGAKLKKGNDTFLIIREEEII